MPRCISNPKNLAQKTRCAKRTKMAFKFCWRIEQVPDFLGFDDDKFGDPRFGELFSPAAVPESHEQCEGAADLRQYHSRVQPSFIQVQGWCQGTQRIVAWVSEELWQSRCVSWKGTPPMAERRSLKCLMATHRSTAGLALFNSPT